MNIYNFEINNVTNFSFLGTEGSKFENSGEPKMPSGQLSFSSTSETPPSQTLSQTQSVTNQENVERATIKVWNVSEALSEEFFSKFFTAADENSVVKKVDDSYVVDIAKDKANLIIQKLNNWEISGTVLKASIIEKSSLQVRVWNLSNLIPEQFFMEFFKYLMSELVIKKFDDHYIVEGPRDVAEMIVHKLNKGYIVDTNLRACVIGEEDYVVSIDRKQSEIVSSIYLYCYYSKKLEFAEGLRSTYGKVLKSRNYKTAECSGTCSGSQNVCMFYHGVNDKRRNLDAHRYTHEMCPYPKVTSNICVYGNSCTYSHTLYEQMFHPTNIHTILCPSIAADCQKQPFCKFAHKNTPEMFYNENWCHLLAHGIPNTFKFFVGAINEISKIPSNYDVKICLISPCQELLDMAEKCIADVLQALRIKSVILDTKWINTDQYQIFLGTPDVIANYHDKLLNEDTHGALIIDGITQILENSESRMNVRRIIQKLYVKQNSKVNVVCVSNFYDSEIIHYLLGTLGLNFIDIGPFAVDPYYPVKSNLAAVLPLSEPKILYNPMENSQEVSSSSITPTEKYSTSETKRSRSKSRDRDLDRQRSAQSDKKSGSKSRDRDLDRQRSAKSDKRSRSKSRDRDLDRQRSAKSDKRSRSKSRDRDLDRQRSDKHDKKSRSKSRDRDLDCQRSVKSVKRSRSKSRDRDLHRQRSAKPDKRSRSKSRDRDLDRQRSVKSAKKSRSKSHDRDLDHQRSASSAKTSSSKSRDCDLDRQQYTSSTKIAVKCETEVKKEPSPSHDSSEKFRSKKLNEKSDISVKEEKKETLGKQHNSSLESDKSKCQRDKDLNVQENKNSDVDANLKIILGEELYRSFVVEKTEIQKSHEKEFDAYITFPELHPEYNIHYKEFLEDYSQKHSDGQSETRRTLWKEFWKTKLRIIMDEDWKKRKNELFLKYRSKIESKVKGESKTSDTVLNTFEANSAKIESDVKNYETDSKSEKNLKKSKSSSNKTKPKLEKLKIEWNKSELKKNESAKIYDNILKKYKPQSNKYENFNNNNKYETTMKKYVSNSKTRKTDIKKFVNSENKLKIGSGKSATDSKKSEANSKKYESYSKKYDHLSKTDVKKDNRNSRKGDGTESKELKSESNSSERHKSKELKSTSNSSEQRKFRKPPDESSEVPREAKRSDRKPPDESSEVPREAKRSDRARSHAGETASEDVVSFDFTVAKTLDLLEKLSSKLGIIGPSIMAMVKSAKDLGTDNENALQIFLDVDNIGLINMVIRKFEALQKSPSEDGPTLTLAIKLIKQLLEYAKNPPKKVAALDVEQIARSCLGKSPPFIVSKIKEALANDPSRTITKEDINKIFLQVCDLQFKLQI